MTQRDTPPCPADLLAPEAIRRGWLEVRESGGGTVQELEAENLGLRPVLLLEGEPRA
jgi:hypothetical protein